MEDIILKCERIEKKYSKTKALDNINLSIYTGHIYALIGENGAGKTTLMRIISGLIGSDNGKMELNRKTSVLSGAYGKRKYKNYKFDEKHFDRKRNCGACNEIWNLGKS